ncbi:MAG: serine/threonine-protein kinase [Lysobacterales bacterium]
MTAARPRGSGSVDATTDLGLGAASAEDPTVRGRVSGDDGDASAEQETEPCPMVTAVNLDALSTDAGKPTKKLDELPPLDADEEPVFKHPEQIGPFRILRLLGEGGMGAVYLAEQSEPVKRQVALKLVHASLRSPMALARFTAERQAMARLSHPNVAQLYEAGTTRDGFPYFAMEYMPGKAFVDYCNLKRLDIRERVAMFVQICQGVHHAHQKGLIHRDLKPSNLLVAEIDGQAVPKVIDFGIAKAVDQPLGDEAELTGAGAIGTPSYMSPEAFAANSDLDTRTDVYSLGIVLYELLVGVRPHDVSGAALVKLNASGRRPESKRLTVRISGLEETRVRAIAEERRMSKSELAEHLRADLDWIVTKAIAEDRDQRYASVAELAADLNRFLANQPVEARPPTFRYRAGKFVRRHRLAVAAAAMVLVALILGIVGTSVGMIKAAREAEAARQVSSFLTRVFEVSDPGEARGNTVTARELLDQAAHRIQVELQDQPIVRARLMRTMGGVYQNLGLYAEAVPLEEAALAARRAALGDQHPDVGRSLNALGTLYNRAGRYQEAEPLQRQAVAILERSLGPASPDLAEAQMQLGLTCFLLGKSDEAESLYRSALAIRESALGPDHPDVAANLSHLGYLLNNQERYQEAEPFLLRALKIRESALGPDHFLVALSLDLLGDLYGREGRNAEAQALYLRSLAIKRKVYAPDHPLIAESHFALGNVYAAQGKAEQAAQELRTGLAMVETSLGPTHISLSRGLQSLGMLLANQGQWQEAEGVFRRLVAVYEAAVGPSHQWVGEALNNLGWVLSDGLQRYPEAELVLRRAVAIFPMDGKPGFAGALARWSLANCLRDQHRAVDALPYYAEALEILETAGGSKRQDNPQLPDLIADYAKSLRAADRPADAATLESRGL